MRIEEEEDVKRLREKKRIEAWEQLEQYNNESVESDSANSVPEAGQIHGRKITVKTKDSGGESSCNEIFHNSIVNQLNKPQAI